MSARGGELRSPEWKERVARAEAHKWGLQNYFAGAQHALTTCKVRLANDIGEK